MSSTPHDRLFRGVFSRAECAADLLRGALPEAVLAHLDLGALALESDSFVEESLRGVESDLLYRAELAGAEAYVYVLLEHQSTHDPLMPFRLLRYMVAIWRRWLDDHPAARALPAIVPLVVHHGAGGWRSSARFADLYALPDAALHDARAHLPDFAFVLDDIAGATDDDLRRRAMTELATLVLWLLANARGAEAFTRRMADVRDLFLAVAGAPRGVHALARVWRYIMEVTDVSTEAIDHFIDIELGRHAEAREALMTGAEILHERGREQGRQEGRREGRQEAAAELLTRLLERRFGPLEASATERIARASGDELMAWAERVATAATVEDVFAG